jgi:hypothetical protein
VTRDGIASGKQAKLSPAKSEDETITGNRKGDTPVNVSRDID